MADWIKFVITILGSVIGTGTVLVVAFTRMSDKLSSVVEAVAELKAGQEKAAAEASKVKLDLAVLNAAGTEEARRAFGTAFDLASTIKQIDLRLTRIEQSAMNAATLHGDFETLRLRATTDFNEAMSTAREVKGYLKDLDARLKRIEQVMKVI